MNHVTDFVETTNEHYDDFIARLEGAHKVGQRDGYTKSFRSCCPCCGGKDNTRLSTSLRENGKIDSGCFACNADSLVVAHAIGLVVRDLYPRASHHYPPEVQKDRLTWSSLAALSSEASLLSIELAIVSEQVPIQPEKAIPLIAPLAMQLARVTNEMRVAAKQAMRKQYNNSRGGK